jgi:hypothetical protein
MGFSPKRYEKAARYRACGSTDIEKCAPADGTNAAVEIDRGSARPSAAIEQATQPNPQMEEATQRFPYA